MNLDVFVDGSKRDSVISGSAILVLNDKKYFKLSDNFETEIFKEVYGVEASHIVAEFYAIHSFLIQIKENENLRNINFVIYTDCEACYHILNHLKTPRKKHIVEISRIIKNVISILNSQGINIDIIWIPAHQKDKSSKTYYNALVDTLTRCDIRINQIKDLTYDRLRY